MVYKSRPEASDAQLAWDRFTVLHEAQPLEMEFLDGDDSWRFRYLDSSENASEVRLGAAGLEAVGSPDPAKLLRIQATWERAARVREGAGEPWWLVYLWFGNATIMAAGVITTSVFVLRKGSGESGTRVHSDVLFAVSSIVMSWIFLAAHLALSRRKKAPRWAAASSPNIVFFLLSFGVLQLLMALGDISGR